MYSCGVPLGAISPRDDPPSTLNPCSMNVGMLGASGKRALLPIASALSCPCSMKRCTSPSALATTSTWPPSSAVRDWPPPSNGTCRSLTLAASSNAMRSRCVFDPAPAEEMGTSPGRFFASAASAASVWYLPFGSTANTAGSKTRLAMGTKLCEVPARRALVRLHERVGHVHEADRVAIRLRLRDLGGADVAARAALVDDDDLGVVAQILLDVRHDEARRQVRAAAGRKRHDQRDRAFRVRRLRGDAANASTRTASAAAPSTYAIACSSSFAHLVLESLTAKSTSARFAFDR